MGIHYTYKSQSGERDLQKKQKQEELRRRSEQRKALKQKKQIQKADVYVVPEDEVLTLDILTNPEKNSD